MDTAWPVNTEWRVGDTILDSFQVLAIIGEGPTGTVYKAYDRARSIEVAIKKPRPQMFAGLVGIVNFVSVAASWLKLPEHPHVVRCLNLRPTGRSVPFVLTEYVAGGSLPDWITTGRLYNGQPEAALERMLDIAIQSAWGLGHVHAHGCTHGNVKPSNLMMMPDGMAKVTDISMAQAYKAAALHEPVCPSPKEPTELDKYKRDCEDRAARQADVFSWAQSMAAMFHGAMDWDKGYGRPDDLDRLVNRPRGGQIPPMPASLAALLKTCLGMPFGRPDMREIAARVRAIYEDTVGMEYWRAETGPGNGPAENSAAPPARSFPKDARDSEPESRRGEQLLVQARADLAEGRVAAALAAVYEARSLPGHEESVQERLLLALLDDRCRRTGLRDATVKHVIPAWAPAALSANGRWAFGGNSENGFCLSVWDVESNSVRASDLEPPGNVASVAVSADGGWALAGSQERHARLWKTGDRYHSHLQTVGRVRSVCLAPDGRLAVVASYYALESVLDVCVTVWDSATARPVCVFGSSRLVDSISMSLDCRWVLAGGEQVEMWDVASGNFVRSFDGHTDRVLGVCFTAGGQRAVTGSWDGTVRLWDIAGGSCLRVFERLGGRVNAVCATTDGQWIISAGSDRVLRVWEVSTGRCVRVLEGHTDEVTSLSLSASGRRLLSSSDDHTIRQWELDWELEARDEAD